MPRPIGTASSSPTRTALANGFNALICCGSADDVAFLTALTQHLVKNWRADADRVYLTGISNGGDMSFRAAVEASGLFAAIGVVSGGLQRSPHRADHLRPVEPGLRGDDHWRSGPVLPHLPVRHGDVAAAPASARPSVRRRPLPRRRSPGRSTRCADGSDVDVYVVTDIGHVWPGATSGPLADRNAPIAATDIVWDFFAAHPKQR